MNKNNISNISCFARTELLIGNEAMNILKSSRVAVFGIGGVGGHAAEALVRSGIGEIDVIDNDKVSITNINRQILATYKNIGEYKTDAAKRRFTEINPDIKVNTHKVFYMPETAAQFNFSEYDYIVDAIDTVTGKIEIVTNALRANTPVISSMGAGNKLDPTAFEIADIYQTSVCPLARVMRQELRKRGIDKLKVVYSREKPLVPEFTEAVEAEASTVSKKRIPGSIAFVPSVAGLIIAGEVIKDIIKLKLKER